MLKFISLIFKSYSYSFQPWSLISLTLGHEQLENRQIKPSTMSQTLLFRPCLVTPPKIFHPSHRTFGQMHGTLNVDKKIN